MPLRLSREVISRLLDAETLNHMLERDSESIVAKEIGISQTTLRKYLDGGLGNLDKLAQKYDLLDDRDYLIEKLSSLSMTQLAKNLEVSRTLLSKYVAVHGIEVGSLAIDNLVALNSKQHHESLTVPQLADKLGVSQTTVRKYRRGQGINVRRKKKLTSIQSEKLNDYHFVSQYLEKGTIADLSRTLDVPYSTVTNHCRRLGLSRPHLGADVMSLLSDAQKLSGEIGKKSITQIARTLDVDSKTVTKYCNIHGIEIPRNNPEMEIAGWLREEGIAFVSNCRKTIRPLELDFLLSEHRVAIEHNGVYWHSERFLDKTYHAEKLKRCRDVGITLLMINGDEWEDRPDAVKQSILHRLGRGKRGVGARKLQLRRIGISDANSFFDQHHIQGATSAIFYACGGFYEDHLVTAMAFSRQRGTGAVELVRFSGNGSAHAGSFSRLFRFAVGENDFDQVLSFADKRYSVGDVYLKNGFRHCGEIAPDYRYVIGSKTHHKSNFTKARIEKKFGLDMSDRTERQAMLELNIPRIYDCGKIKLIWSRDK